LVPTVGKYHKQKEGMMSRKAITILFVIGSCFYLPGIGMIIRGYISLIQSSVQNAYASSSSFEDGMSMFLGLVFVGVVLAVIGGITLLVARIGALIEIAKAQEWVWFILMLIFGWVVLLIYLIAVPKPKLAQPPLAYVSPAAPASFPWSQAPGIPPQPGQIWPGYQQPEQQGSSQTH
jgi:hypothetical protein